MKKIAALCIGVGCMLTVTGCGSNVTLNTEQNDMVSELSLIHISEPTRP